MTNVVALRNGFNYLVEHIDEWDQSTWRRCFARMIMEAHDRTYNPEWYVEVDADAVRLIEMDTDDAFEKFFSPDLEFDTIKSNVEAYESQNQSRAESTIK